MSNLCQLLEEVEQNCKQADNNAKKIASILRGRLRKVADKHSWYSDHQILADLKRELSQYDAKKREWKS